MLVCWFIGAFLASMMMTAYIRRVAVAKALMDIPNSRSSHTKPTPRGGGVAFALVFLGLLPVLSFYKMLPSGVGAAFVLAGITIAVLGFLDDRYRLVASTRLCVHFLVSIVTVVSLKSMPSLSIFHFQLPSGSILSAFVVVYLVWLINLYNFMDGIDGLAGMEAVSVCFGAALMYWLGGDFRLIPLPLGLACAVGGFLCWNMPKAKIFMGDVGSSFLGVVLGIMSIHAALIQRQYFWAWLILLGVFIVDATITLGARAFAGKKLSQAHCNHAYQHATKAFKSHFVVTMSVVFINVFWLAPWALLVSLGYVEGALGLTFAYLPLVMLAVKYRAGVDVKMKGIMSFG